MSPIIIGSGHNALVAAFYLARAGRRPIVLERRDAIGGGAITGEIHPGFRCPTLSHEVLLHERIVRDMELERHGLEWIAAPSQVCALSPGGAPLVVSDDPAQTAERLRAFSASDAAAWPEFRRAIERVASVIAALFETAPPNIDAPGAGDVWSLLKTGRRFRALGRRDGYRLLRWAPMPAADLVGEWFENDLLRATIAAPGTSGAMFGPRSAGSTLILLAREAHRQLAGRRALRARGGPGAVSAALAAAARAAGAEIRVGTPVDRILVEDGRARGVVAGGQALASEIVLSGVDPRTTFLGLLDATDLTPDFATKARNFRAAGSVAKVNLALAELPSFGVDPAVLGGRIHIGPSLDYLERAFDHAKYGEMSAEPWLDVSIPTIADPGLAPAGGHVASIYVHYAPYRLRAGWDGARDALLAATLNVLDRYAPGIRGTVVAAEVLTPLDLERTYGFAGGHIFHGELALDQLFTMRPLLGFAGYDSPIRGLFLCGAGTHPGGFMTGASGRLAAHAVLRTRQI